MIASSSRGSRCGMSPRITPWPQSTRIAVEAVSTRIPDAGVSGCGADVPAPMTVTRVMGRRARAASPEIVACRDHVCQPSPYGGSVGKPTFGRPSGFTAE